MAFLLSLLLAMVHSVVHVERAMGLPLIYNTTSGPVADKLNVHLVPHSHDDVGWLKTVDQYYSGTNNSIQNAAVHLILDTVVDALQEDPNRKFIFVEQAFFQRWWREQTTRKQKIVKKLVNAGQLEFINGGWCMHDEATTHYIDMIDQTTLGHKYIKEQFGKVPRCGWQIDPFGHSAVQGYLLGAELGFNGIFFARIDYQDKLKRLNESTMEMVWRASKTFGDSAQVFAGALYDFYYPPKGFNFDFESFDTPIQDDPLLFDFNVQERVDDFVKYAETQASHFRTNHIMWTLGGDFQYQNAHGWYKQLDKFINWVNKVKHSYATYVTKTSFKLGYARERRREVMTRKGRSRVEPTSKEGHGRHSCSPQQPAVAAEQKQSSVFEGKSSKEPTAHPIRRKRRTPSASPSPCKRAKRSSPQNIPMSHFR
ncbi:hypothetical protein L7F22_005614 [Adiantum nelumboides]|nr:hypothetical protein [Adiantum nelumboides]